MMIISNEFDKRESNLTFQSLLFSVLFVMYFGPHVDTIQYISC
mgnify:FL=1